MAKNYRAVRDFPSKSSPGKRYTVSIDETGALSCDCMGWTRRNPPGGRTCTHVQQVEAEDGNLAPAPMPVPQAAAREKGGSLSDLLARIDKE